MTKITFISQSFNHCGAQTLTFAIDGKRYVYQMTSPIQCDAAMYMARKVSAAKALNYVKKRGKLLEDVV